MRLPILKCHGAKNHVDEKNRVTSLARTMEVTRMTLMALAVLLFVTHASVASDRESLDGESLRSYMVGEYELIGRKPDSTATYTGHVAFRDEDGVLQVARVIDGKSDLSVARFDTVAGTDRIPVLKMHFHFDGKDYNATYRWQSDPDNYPRFTGYVYLAGTKSPGIEALFPIHKRRQPDDCIQ